MAYRIPLALIIPMQYSHRVANRERQRAPQVSHQHRTILFVLPIQTVTEAVALLDQREAFCFGMMRCLELEERVETRERELVATETADFIFSEGTVHVTVAASYLR